jgi:hypothetical protein
MHVRFKAGQLLAKDSNLQQLFIDGSRRMEWSESESKRRLIGTPCWGKKAVGGLVC